MLLAYGLPRFSVDLDFDDRSPGTDLTRPIRAGTADGSLGVEALTTKKNTDPCAAPHAALQAATRTAEDRSVLPPPRGDPRPRPDS